MGAWGPRAFDNDTACDWKCDLAEEEDFSLVEDALEQALRGGEDVYLDQAVACRALAACEVIARARGNFGYQNAYTETVDEWVKGHRLKPAPELVELARRVTSRVLGRSSELRELWDDADAEAWRAAMKDLRARLR